MTKNELMDLSRECGLEFCEEECAQSVFVSLAQLANAVLERAAVECEEFGFNEDRPFDYGARIRALKVDNQAQKGQA